MSDSTQAPFILDIHQQNELEQYLATKDWIASWENIRKLTRPGEGNMNYTLRVHTNLRTFIVKQARPFVVKYPQVPAPPERAEVEAAFFHLAQTHEKLRLYIPELMGHDAENHLLVLQDLGQSRDFSFLYQPGKHLTEAELNALMAFITILHNQFTTHSPDPLFENHAMRILNAEHIFRFPFNAANGHDLDQIQPGLQDLAGAYRSDAALLARIADLEQVYLGDGPCLLHGDFYPGSWLQTLEGVRVIDPEFCFYGRPEYDLGVLVAHLMMAEQPADLVEGVMDTYQAPSVFDRRLMDQFTGVEILRRLIGLAQLPLSLSLEKKKTLMDQASALLKA